MNNAIQDALDDLSSFRSSTSRQGRALDTLERLLADICVSGNDHVLQSFNTLQDTFQANIPSRLLTWIADRSTYLDTLSQKGTVAQEQVPEVTTLSSHLIQSLSIIQGVVLNHERSKQYLGRRFALEILIDLFLVARHVTPMLSTPSTNNTESQPKQKGTPSASLSTAVLDTLLCIMVDSSAALRAFEEANGVRAVVRILKRAGTARETRMKCLEFLYFYLLDETSASPNIHIRDSLEIPTAPNSPTGHSHPRSALSLSQLSDSSVSSGYSSSSGGSNISMSTTATSAPSSSPSSPTCKDLPPLAPPPLIRPGPKRAASREPSGSQPRSLLMLRREVDFTPETPTGAKSTSTPRPLSRLKQQSSEGSVFPSGEWKTPKRMPPRMQATSLSESDPSTPASSALRARGHRRAHTIDVQADPKVLSPPMSPERLRFMHSAGVAMSVVGNVNVVSPPRRPIGTRTMEEKKAILGGMMGNVDTLVEGVKKAGIWGLG